MDSRIRFSELLFYAPSNCFGCSAWGGTSVNIDRDKSIAPRELVSPFSMGYSVLCMVFEGLHGWDVQTEINQTKAACASNRWISGLLSRCRDLYFNYHHQSMGIQMDVMHMCNALTISLVQSLWGQFWGDLWQQMPGDSCRLGLVMLKHIGLLEQLGVTEILMLLCPSHLNLQWSS